MSKIIITTLLVISVCIGCRGKDETITLWSPTIKLDDSSFMTYGAVLADDTSRNGIGIFGVTKSWKYDTTRKWIYYPHDTVEVIHIDTLPNKKIKNLKKMKPRKDTAWVSDLVSYESLHDNRIDSVTTLQQVFDLEPIWYRYDTIKQVQDTIKCVLLVSDSSATNGFRSQRAYWMYGYMLWVTKEFANESIIGYLDSNKSPLKKNIVVWVTKPVVQ